MPHTPNANCAQDINFIAYDFLASLDYYRSLGGLGVVSSTAGSCLFGELCLHGPSSFSKLLKGCHGLGILSILTAISITFLM